jgi:hypothetical protein
VQRRAGGEHGDQAVDVAPPDRVEEAAGQFVPLARGRFEPRPVLLDVQTGPVRQLASLRFTSGSGSHSPT